MSEYLVITTRQNVLDVVEQMRVAEHLKVNIEGDFTRGLKAIFYGLPEVVFIQDEIAGISGEKVAGQVKTLLEGEPIRLVLLREHAGEGDGGYPGFDGVIDIGLPFEELAGCFRRELGILPGSGAEPPVVPETVHSFGESPLELTDMDNGLEFDPFSDVFPAKFHPSWGPVPPEAVQEPAVDDLHSKDSYEPSFFEEEFSFDPPGDIVTYIPLDKHPAAGTMADGGIGGAGGSGQRSGAVPSTGTDGELKDLRLADKESPHQLFASMSDDAVEELPTQEAAPPPSAASVGERLRLKGVEPRSSLLRSEPVSATPATSSAATAPSPRQPSPASSNAKARAPRYAAEPCPRAVLPDTEYTGGLAAKRSLARLAMPSLFIILLGFAAYLSVYYWDDLTLLLPGGKESTVPIPVPPPPRKAPVATPATLPEFFPKVPLDGPYAAAHPGWERYRADGLDYLAYRENGKIMALQVVAGRDGKMDEGFLATCIGQTAGQATGVKWVREERDGFLVEKATLSAREEVAVYRKMPEGEIRGVVLTFR